MQKLTILFDLDGTLVDTAPDLIRAHNYVMKKFGYPTKSIEELKNAVGRGAKAMMEKTYGKWQWFDEKIKNEMSKEFISYYGCLLYTSPSPRDRTRSRMPSSA